MACTVVSISHASGAGGEEVGRLVAEQLGFSRADEEIVAEAAASGGLDAGDVAGEERRRSLVARLLEAMGQSGAEAWALGATPAYNPNEIMGSADLRGLIRRAIEETAERGNVVIVAHAASHALGARPGHLRVLVTASPDTRAGRIGESLGLDGKQAARAVKDSDAARRDYLKRFYGVDEESPTQYDLVVNTDVLSVEQAAELVAQAAS
jgi:Cytidylate kinase-like family